MHVLMIVSAVAACALLAWLFTRPARRPALIFAPALNRTLAAPATTAPGVRALERLRSPLDAVAALLCFIAGTGWADARSEAVAALHQVGNRRDVDTAVAAAERAVRAGIDPVAAIDHLTAHLKARMDRAELACVTQMLATVAYSAADSSTRASRAAALLLKG